MNKNVVRRGKSLDFNFDRWFCQRISCSRTMKGREQGRSSRDCEIFYALSTAKLWWSSTFCDDRSGMHIFLDDNQLNNTQWEQMRENLAANQQKTEWEFFDCLLFAIFSITTVKTVDDATIRFKWDQSVPSWSLKRFGVPGEVCSFAAPADARRWSSVCMELKLFLLCTLDLLKYNLIFIFNSTFYSVVYMFCFHKQTRNPSFFSYRKKCSPSEFCWFPHVAE